MLLLLDSQTALWVLDGSPRLGKQARSAIVAATQTHVSAATIWELTIKARLGKLKIPERLADRISEQGLSLVDITADDAEAIREFPALARHDPFDRLIVAQARRTGLTLLTADRVLLDLGLEFVVDATR
jgi:PIN domain nuclease of toxin-antitoxin system